ncbi:MAG TPA: glycosyltransferase [Candidatus Norongarragalinales archaeon]|nr:glycosyltransferase [Candidatus Norongarragalinales archaeon]
MLSTVIPAHREEKRIGTPLRKLDVYLLKRKIRHEIIVVTDGEDATASVAKKACPEVIVFTSLKRQGKGAAINQGLRLSRGDTLCVYDADGATPPKEIRRALHALESADVVIGVRKAGQRPWYRRIVSMCFHTITRYLFGLPFTDTQCGFKVFRADKTRPILKKMISDGLQWDVEFLWRCGKKGLRVREFTVRWKSVPGGPLESDKIRNVLTLLWDVLTLRLKKI